MVTRLTWNLHLEIHLPQFNMFTAQAHIEFAALLSV